MRISWRMGYAAQMALVLALGAGLVAMTRAQSAAHAEKTRAPAVAPGGLSAVAGATAPAEVAGVLMTKTPAEVARGGSQVAEVARLASGDLDRYGGHGSERAATGSANADTDHGERATQDTRTRASPEG